MAKVKVTKFNFSDEMMEKAKQASPLVGALMSMASEVIADKNIPSQQALWVDTDKVLAVGEIIKAREDAGVPDIYQVYFSFGEKPEMWQIVADTYDEFMKAWIGSKTED